MKPPRFEYHAPRALDEALTLLARHGEGAKVLAGGQSLIPLLNFRLAHPTALVDINRIGDLAYIRASADGLAIGALARQHAVETSPEVRARAPILAEACRFIGHLPIRHRGTIGGSLAHADPASELPAVMVALEAELALARAGSRRSVAAERFFVGPLSTALGPGEMLVEVRVPDAPRAHRRRLHGDGAPRRATSPWWAWPPSSRSTRPAAASARASPCAASGPRRFARARAEDALLGGAPSGAALDEAARRAAEATSPPSDVHGSAAFRRKLAHHFTREAIAMAAERATRS